MGTRTQIKSVYEILSQTGIGNWRVISRKGAKAQRKTQRKYLIHATFFAFFLCAFAPLREISCKSCLTSGPHDSAEVPEFGVEFFGSRRGVLGRQETAAG